MFVYMCAFLDLFIPQEVDLESHHVDIQLLDMSHSSGTS